MQMRPGILLALGCMLCGPVALSAEVQSTEAEAAERSAQQIRQDRELADRMIGFGNAAGAREILARLCHEDGDDIACQNLGVMAMTGEGGEVDMAAGRAAFARGCDLQLPEACQNLADALVNGEGGPVEDVRALSLYYQLCTRGYGGRNCHRAAMMIETGRGVTEPDAAKAQEAYARACDLGFRPACQRVETGS
ncbi:MAG: sel1 repeat family protein [Erythrobacter sp.]|nr:sel1 repeat family protein [Erythrobacter sp.]NCQ64269.1 sel1 repeat family protein [Alphaproteobacteria bacterium]